MLFKTFSAAVFGIDAYLVEVEVDVAPAFQPNFNVVGLPDVAVKASRERIRLALRNCGFAFPSGHTVIVNLALADIRKQGSAFDLPMALGLQYNRPASERMVGNSEVVAAPRRQLASAW